MNQTEKNALSDHQLIERMLKLQQGICYMSYFPEEEEEDRATAHRIMLHDYSRFAEYKRELLKRAAKRRRLEAQIADARKQARTIGIAISTAISTIPPLHEILGYEL